jgi:hypothetical protein
MKSRFLTDLHLLIISEAVQMTAVNTLRFTNLHNQKAALLFAITADSITNSVVIRCQYQLNEIATGEK